MFGQGIRRLDWGIGTGFEVWWRWGLGYRARYIKQWGGYRALPLFAWLVGLRERLIRGGIRETVTVLSWVERSRKGVARQWKCVGVGFF